MTSIADIAVYRVRSLATAVRSRMVRVALAEITSRGMRH
jgi:hypothetical protein